MFLFLLLTFSLFAVQAQITASSLTGRVTDSKGQVLAGATVKAVHVPSGTVYTTTTTSKGDYTIPNMRVGDNYTVTVSHVGHDDASFDHLTLSVGEPLNIDAILNIQGQTLNAATVTAGTRNGIISS